MSTQTKPRPNQAEANPQTPQITMTPKFEEFIRIQVKTSNFLKRVADRKLRVELTEALQKRVTEQLGEAAAGLAINQIHQLLANTESLEVIAPVADYPQLQQMVQLWALYRADVVDYWAIYEYYAEHLETAVESLWMQVLNAQIAKRDRLMLDMLAPRALKPGHQVTPEEEDDEGFLSSAAPSNETSASG